MTQTESLADIRDIIDGVAGVLSTNIWQKAGHGRIYIDLPKLNGGRAWNGGRAGTVWYDGADGQIHTRGDWAGAATRNRACDIIAEIESALHPQPAMETVGR